ncbi:MAG: HAMP domain-containing sensor histidine kinase [Cyanobacteria bacterium J06638_22]
MSKPSLRSRLFFSHLIVTLLGAITFITISKVFSPRYFVIFLEGIAGPNIALSGPLRRDLVQAFQAAWNRGAYWSVIVGTSTAGVLSYLVSRRVVKPLIQMEDITKNFAAGDWQERMPSQEILELDQLAHSFNRMAAELQNVEQRRRDLVTDLTHELRTPLTIVEGYLEGLSDSTIAPSPELYQLLVRETLRMRRLVNDLQELSKIEAGYLPIDTKPTALHPILSSVVQRFADQVFDKEQLTIILDVEPDLPLVAVDALRIEQVLVNLVGNALRYTNQGSITVKAWQVGDRVWTAVSDTGIGIAPEDLPHIFERFWRSDRSRARHSGGTGIGLAISHRLVELQQGTMEVESELGKGSSFRFSLPLAP